MSTITKLEAARRRLHARRRDLLARYRDLIERAEDAATAHEPDVIDRAEDEWDARVLSMISDADAHALDAVVGALRRIDRGTYGRCTSCGGSIDRQRLHALPEAVLCATCAVDAEERTPRWTFAVGV